MDLVSDIVRREADYTKGIEPLRTMKTQYEELMGVFKPYETMLAAENATPKAAMANLLQTAAILRTGSPALKVQLAANLMRQFGIPFEQVGQLLSGGGATPVNGNGAPVIDPQVQLLAQQVEQLTSAQQAEYDARARAAIQQFAADPANKYFDAVSDEIADLLENSRRFREQTAGLPEGERLKRAYDTAVDRKSTRLNSSHRL